MELHEWWDYAKDLPVGGRARGDHSCGDPGTLLVSRAEDGSYASYCFRCGDSGQHRKQESLQEKLERITAQRNADESAMLSVQLPEPREYDTKTWPLADKVWFFKQGFSLRMIEELGLYWCPSIGRVVLPITVDDRVVFWQARSQTRQPKWIGPQVPKHGLVSVYGKGKGDTIVLTEDSLSAYKVGRSTEAWSLLGTKMTAGVMMQLIESGRRVATWLDDDRGRRRGNNPGQEAARAIGARLRAFGVDVRNITSPKDPKYYPDQFIQEKVNGIP